MSRFFVGGDSLKVYKEEIILNDNLVKKYDYVYYICHNCKMYINENEKLEIKLKK